jgi:raffinose/stachyose/melibiose transport system substrate-binding protein
MTGTYTRRGFLGLSAAAVAASVAACTGGGTAPAPAGGGSSGPASNDLRVFTYEDKSTVGLFKEQIAKFDAQAGTTTTVDNLPGSGAAIYPDKLRTELLGGKGPDVWRIWGGQIGAPFVKAKQAMDLAPYYQKFGWDSKINTAAIEGMTFEGVKGGLPYIALGIGCWYNKAAFKKAGIAGEPKTYAEMEEANDKLVSAGITPAGLGG